MPALAAVGWSLQNASFPRLSAMVAVGDLAIMNSQIQWISPDPFEHSKPGTHQVMGQSAIVLQPIQFLTVATGYANAHNGMVIGGYA
jgi:hypothetical protein